VNKISRRILLAGSLVAVFALGVSFGQNKFGEPKTLIHVVALKWKASATPAQRQAAIDGIRTMAGKIPGIKNVWLKTNKVQGISQANPYDAAFAIEFADEASLKAYATHPAHDEWMKLYEPAREESRNHVVTN
jgi:antibiotic biosynthesis monooxygenase (ABM) superfamily enzyme